MHRHVDVTPKTRQMVQVIHRTIRHSPTQLSNAIKMAQLSGTVPIMDAEADRVVMVKLPSLERMSNESVALAVAVTSASVITRLVFGGILLGMILGCLPVGEGVFTLTVSALLFPALNQLIIAANRRLSFFNYLVEQSDACQMALDKLRGD